ncbi:MAG: hypothetical protein HQL95_00295 [Magnetococcales bacterium]|nr:hypothetical protein [Magnetococcales bacterium]
MIKLGDLILPDSIQWKNRYEWAPVAQETARTLGGQNIVWGSALVGGRPIDLEAEGDVTWLTLAQVEAIHAMAMQPGGVFDLILDDETFQVMFRHQDQPATSFTPIFPHAGFFNGLIKLMQAQ